MESLKSDRLLGGKQYALRIDPGALIDLADNPFPGITDDATWTFTTAIPGGIAADHPYKSAPRVQATAVTTLAGVVSDAENDPLTHTWSVVSGPAAVTFGDANVLDTTATFTAPGIYSLRLTANDGTGESTDEVTITVTDATRFTIWADDNDLAGEDADPAAILHADGLTNLQKFAFGIDPRVTNFSPLEYVAEGELIAPGAPTPVNSAQRGHPDDERAVFSRRKDHVEVGLVYTAHFSADLKGWTASDVTPTLLTHENSTGDYEVVSVPFPGTVSVEGGGDPRPPKFMRVSVSME